MSGTAIPAAWAALTATFTAAGVPDVTVIKGPLFDPPANFLTVGWDRTDQPSITASNTRLGLAVGRRGDEEFDISSLLSFQYDANTIDVALEALFAAYEQFSAALTADPTLGHVVLDAQINGYDFTPHLAEIGTVMDLRFTTHIQAVR